MTPDELNDYADDAAEEIFAGWAKRDALARKTARKAYFRSNKGKAPSPTGSGNPPFRHHVGLKKIAQQPSLVETLLYGIIGVLSLMLLCIVGVYLEMGLQSAMMIIVYFICNYMYGRGYFPFLYRKPMNQIPCTGCRVTKCGFKHDTD